MDLRERSRRARIIARQSRQIHTDAFKDAAFEHALVNGDQLLPPEAARLASGSRRQQVLNAWWHLAILREPELAVLAEPDDADIHEDIRATLRGGDRNRAAYLALDFVNRGSPQAAAREAAEREAAAHEAAEREAAEREAAEREAARETEEVEEAKFDPQEKMLRFVSGGYACHPDDSTEKGYITGPDAMRARAAMWMRDGKNDGTRDISGVGVPRQDVAESFVELEALCKRINVDFELIRRTIFSIWGSGAAKLDDLLPAHYGEVFVAADYALQVRPDFDDNPSNDHLECKLSIDGDAVLARPTSANAFLKYTQTIHSIMEYELKWDGERGGIIDHGEWPCLQKRALEYLLAQPKTRPLAERWGAAAYIDLMAQAVAEDDTDYSKSTAEQMREEKLARKKAA